MVVRRGNRLGDLRIPDHDIGIRPFHDRALLGVDIQDLRHIGRRHGHEFIRCQATGFNAFGPKDRHPFFQPV